MLRHNKASSLAFRVLADQDLHLKQLVDASATTVTGCRIECVVVWSAFTARSKHIDTVQIHLVDPQVEASGSSEVIHRQHSAKVCSATQPSHRRRRRRSSSSRRRRRRSSSSSSSSSGSRTRRRKPKTPCDGGGEAWLCWQQNRDADGDDCADDDDYDENG